ICPALPVSSLVHPTEIQSDNNPGTEAAEQLLVEALDQLEATEVLQRLNRMSIKELLNPVAELNNVFDASDEDIYDAVMDAQAARESSKDDNDENDSDEHIELTPTRKEALQAITVLRRFANEVDDSLARKVEGVLGSFGRMIRVHELKGLKDTKLTGFFTRK
ncbi:hypothetical protein J3R83DRAFT_1390, partial [Lanmaoa asiatica]